MELFVPESHRIVRLPSGIQSVPNVFAQATLVNSRMVRELSVQTVQVSFTLSFLFPLCGGLRPWKSLSMPLHSMLIHSILSPTFSLSSNLLDLTSSGGQNLNGNDTAAATKDPYSDFGGARGSLDSIAACKLVGSVAAIVFAFLTFA